MGNGSTTARTATRQQQFTVPFQYNPDYGIVRPHTGYKIQLPKGLKKRMPDRLASQMERRIQAIKIDKQLKKTYYRLTNRRICLALLSFFFSLGASFSGYAFFVSSGDSIFFLILCIVCIIIDIIVIACMCMLGSDETEHNKDMGRDMGVKLENICIEYNIRFKKNLQIMVDEISKREKKYALIFIIAGGTNKNNWIEFDFDRSQLQSAGNGGYNGGYNNNGGYDNGGYNGGGQEPAMTQMSSMSSGGQNDVKSYLSSVGIENNSNNNNNNIGGGSGSGNGNVAVSSNVGYNDYNGYNGYSDGGYGNNNNGSNNGYNNGYNGGQGNSDVKAYLQEIGVGGDRV